MVTAGVYLIVRTGPVFEAAPVAQGFVLAVGAVTLDGEIVSSTRIRAALRDERLRQRFAELVTAPATEERATPAYHRRFLAEEVARWRPIIQAAGQYAD